MSYKPALLIPIMFLVASVSSFGQAGAPTDREVKGTNVAIGKIRAGKVCFQATDKDDKELDGKKKVCADVTNGSIKPDFKLAGSENPDGYYRVTVEDSSGSPFREPYRKVQITDTSFDFDQFMQSQEPAQSNLFTRISLGVEAFGASSQNTEQRYSVDAFLATPFGRRNTSDPLAKHHWAWVNPRIASLPQNNIASTADVASGALATNSVFSNMGALTQSFEFLGGYEGTFLGARRAEPTETNRTTLSFIVAFGSSTPTSKPTSAMTVYKINDTIIGHYPNVKNATCHTSDGSCTNIVFVPRERDRFFRQYYAGFRIKTFWLNNQQISSFPGIFDLSVGQNEEVTAGRLRGAVLRFDGAYPLVFLDRIGKSRLMSSLFVVCTAFLAVAKPKTRNPILLDPAGDIKANDPSVLILPVPQPNRDYFRLGLALDIAGLLKKPPAAQQKVFQ